MVSVGVRAMLFDGVDSDGVHVQRWVRVLQDTAYHFVRVEDRSRNAYIQVFREGESVHLWRFKATGPRAGLVTFSEQLGELLRF